MQPLKKLNLILFHTKYHNLRHKILPQPTFASYKRFSHEVLVTKNLFTFLVSFMLHVSLIYYVKSALTDGVFNTTPS
jgi:hypothetical protein